MAVNTREKILDAALKLFSQKGYLGATTKEIARTAEVAELTLFRHFNSKDRLFEEAIKNNSFLPALKDLIPEAREMAYDDALTLIAEKFLERLSARGNLIRIMHSEIHLYPVPARNIYNGFIEEVLTTLASFFRELQGRGTLRDFSPELGARAFLGMFFAHFNAKEIMMRMDEHKTDDRTLIREYVGIFVRGTVK